MTKFVHIVQVHPVENGEPNLYKVIQEKEYDTKYGALGAVMDYNLIYKKTQAVYLGCVNDATGELI
jgi:hypothetical protein